jgi:GAF domain-containing protein
MPLCVGDVDRLAAAAHVGEPLALLAAIDGVAAARLRTALFTAMRFDAAAMEVERVYSSDPVSYPLGGRKRKQDTSWGDQVLRRGEVFVGEGTQAIRAAFDDADRILGLGLRGVINAPVIRRGECLGTLNFLTLRDAISAEDVAAARLLALVATATFAADTRR